eukprot:TRINITY_DN31984_c0_g1_i1.p1 TRINITY_DN31984_c0_g1~~TRINITY_DN31984_c0_g1_i1.p1  ORF type:complete len:1710 (+),score=512.71 TRINITY_DN31984_c0_g1_i1:70-5199(+)
MAAQPALPIKFAEVVNLTKLGVAATDIKFKNVNMQSSKFVTVREEAANSVSVIDTKTKKAQKYPAKAIDSAIMHPSSKVIGFRAANNLQIFNLEMKAKMKGIQMNENVVFWKWIDTKTVAIVTEQSVYHWSMDSGADEPTKMFDRSAYEGAVQILEYEASTDGKWLILQGIAAGANGVAGVLQLYSEEKQVSQPTVDATASCFAYVTLDGREAPSTLFCFIANFGTGPRLSIIELGVPKEEAFKVSGEIQFSAEQDFALAMLADHKHGTLFILSKAGYLFLYEVQSAKCVFAKRVSQQTMFASVPHEESGGIITVDQAGRVILIALDEENLVGYIKDTVGDLELALQYALRYKFTGAGDILKQKFERAVAVGNVAAAVKIAAEAPDLRNRQTVAALQSIAGNPPPVLQYFSHLLKTDKLLDFESVELAKLVVASRAEAGKKHLTDWIAQEKLTFSEELGDVLRVFDVKLACSVYLRSNAPEKSIGCLLQLGEFQRILDYAKSINFTPDYPLLLQQLHRVNREKAREFASMLSNNQPSLINVNVVVELFMSQNDAESTTSFLLDFLSQRGDREEDGELQTRLLEINLVHSPQVADAILESDAYNFTHFDRIRIAQMCERVRLYQRALDFYDDLEDKKRVLLIGLNSNLIQPEFVLNYFGDQTAETVLECMKDLMKFNMQQHIRLVVEIAKRYSEALTPAALIKMFEDFDAQTGLYYYLGSFVNATQDPDIVFKYIQAATKLAQLKEVERICRENDHYNAKQVKEYLLEANLKDPRPLIYVCDRHDYIDELTRYLFQNNMFAFIEAYAQKMNQKAAPKVIGSLLDMNCDEEKIKNLISGLRPPHVPIELLVEEILKRNRLRMLLPWLEARRQEGSEDRALHNALGMVYVETNSNPQHFLMNNPFYDSKIVGKFCESRDPHLAFIAYRRAWGECDDELLEVTNKNGFFRDQARYLVERQDLALWSKALKTENEYRRSLIDQVIASALPESRIPDEVSCAVRAFMEAGLPNELMELLERIVLHGPSDGEFRRNKNLQNLLILTAIKSDPARVMDYLSRLDNYDGGDIAKILRADQYKLFEEAFFIYKKIEDHESAVTVLLFEIKDLPRAVEYAAYADIPKVWGLLARAQLNNAETANAIKSFMKAEDPSMFDLVIASANRDEIWGDLIPFLKMARSKIKDAFIDNELLYSYAKVNDLTGLEDFLNTPNISKVEDVGNRVFDEALYEAARILFDWVKNYAKLAICYVHLEQYQAAVDAARKANNIVTWKAVCYACVDAQEFRLAQACGVHIIIFMDHLQDLIHHYEIGGYFNEVIALLEQGINLERAHQGIYTQLGVCYAKYKEEKLMEHIKLFWSKLNIPTLLVTCRQQLHWKEAVFLLTHYDQFEAAVDTMIEHSSECWEHELFKQTVRQTPNSEVFYRAANFYVAEHPLLLNDLLIELSSKLDHTRTVSLIKRVGHLPLIQKYLLSVQHTNTRDVNEAINALWVEEEDHRNLRVSIDTYSAFDQISLAQRLQKHSLLELRRISAYLWKINKKWDVSIEISKDDSYYSDVISTAAESQDQKIAEEVLSYFIQKDRKECFAASLYACYSVIRADVVLELAWRHQLTDMVMPFMIQVFRDYNDKIKALEDKFAQQDADAEAEAKDKQKKEEEEAEKAARILGIPTLGMGMNAPLALPAAPSMGGFGGPPAGAYGFGPAPGMGPPPMNPYGGGFF